MSVEQHLLIAAGEGAVVTRNQERRRRDSAQVHWEVSFDQSAQGLLPDPDGDLDGLIDQGGIFEERDRCLNGTMVRTVVPPAAAPNEGRDNFYAVMDGVTGQKGVVAVGPGSAGYHGGDWKFHAVAWNVEPYLLTSASAVLVAAAAGEVTITRVPENDFLCPIQR